MGALSYDKKFEAWSPGACLEYVAFYVNGGYIVKCELIGACSHNLDVLAVNLTGETLSDAVLCLDHCCSGHRMDCVKELHSVLSALVIGFAAEYVRPEL